MATRTQARLNNLNDRAREVGALDVLTQDDIDALKAFYNFACLKCGASPAISPDHVVPLAAGGSNTIENLQLLCDACNKGKRDRADDYRAGKICTSEYVAQFIAERDEKPKRERKYKRHDWNALRFEYETSTISLRDLAEREDIFPTLLFKRSIAEDWVQGRIEHGRELVAETQKEAIKKDVSSRVMILEAARVALEEWKQNEHQTDLAQLSKILELAARVEGLQLDNKTLTVKDWRDAAQEGTQEDIQAYATNAAAGYFGEDASGGEAERS